VSISSSAECEASDTVCITKFAQSSDTDSIAQNREVTAIQSMSRTLPTWRRNSLCHSQPLGQNTSDEAPGHHSLKNHSQSLARTLFGSHGGLATMNSGKGIHPKLFTTHR
jgi:hypothetical protein